MLTHQKELLEQNYQKLRQHWPNAPVGIYSASIGRRDIEPITFAGIQSVHKKAKLIGKVDLVLIDEAHTVGHRDEGCYRNLLNDLQAINPDLRIIGLTASPYRLGHGMITDKPAIFDGLIEPVTIEQLITEGHLSPLRSKVTQTKLDATGIKKRGGDYIESELQKAFDKQPLNQSIVDEIIYYAEDRKSWLVFCTGVDHATHVKDEFVSRGISCECVTGATPKKERERILSDFKSGRLRCISNVSVLTTGFDAPDTDLIAFLRPTMSPGLYLQMAGRGMRTKSHTDHCLVLDFAGVVETHGPIIAIEPPSKKGNGKKKTKTCPQCKEILSSFDKLCPQCGYEFPAQETEHKPVYLHDDDIMGIEAQEMSVESWQWRVHHSRASGKHMLAVDYYESDLGRKITEYFPVTHEGYAGQKAIGSVIKISQQAGLENVNPELEIASCQLTNAKKPESIRFKREGKFYRVILRVW